jgi:D-alanyl-D-alanine-carboxypeptidase/D-alanyl-D-alanine-endopeptidase
MPTAFSPPPLLSNDAIRQMLLHRVDERRLTRGMVVATTEAKERAIIPHGRRKNGGDRLVDGGTIFEIGSITKLFTALLLADIVQPREADLDEPVERLLPAGVRVPMRNGREINLRDPVSHYSGLTRRPTNLEPYDPDDPYAHCTVDHLYEFLAGHELARTPGDTYEYSNVSAGLLGHALVLRAAGGDYETLVRDRILTPLGLNDTVIALPPRLEGRVASPHDSSLDPVPLWNLGVLAGAGALRSSAADLLSFLEALGDPESPIAASVAPLVTPSAQGGVGLGPLHPDGGVAISHAGGTGGTRSFARYIPEWKRGVVVLSNSNIDAVVDLGVHVLDTRCAPQWFWQERPAEATALARLIGRYQMSPNRVLDVTTSNDRLYVRLSGQAATRVFPLSGPLFLLSF